MLGFSPISASPLSALSSSGAPSTVANLNVTEVGDTGNFQSTTTVVLGAAPIDGTDTVSTVLVLTINGALSISEAADTSSSAGYLLTSVSCLVAESSDSSPTSATITITAAVSRTEVADSVASTGGSPVNSATLSFTEASDNVDASSITLTSVTVAILGGLDTVLSNVGVTSLAPTIASYAVTETGDTLTVSVLVTNYTSFTSHKARTTVVYLGR